MKPALYLNTNIQFQNYIYIYIYNTVYSSGAFTTPPSGVGTVGYGYKYDFIAAKQNGTIVPSNPQGTPSVFELKFPNQNIKGVVR